MFLELTKSLVCFPYFLQIFFCPAKKLSHQGRSRAGVLIMIKGALEIVIWCFERSKPQGITSRLNKNFNRSPIHSTSHYITSLSFFSLSQTTAQILSTISDRKTRKTIMHVLDPIYIP